MRHNDIFKGIFACFGGSLAVTLGCAVGFFGVYYLIMTIFAFIGCVSDSAPLPDLYFAQFEKSNGEYLRFGLSSYCKYSIANGTSIVTCSPTIAAFNWVEGLRQWDSTLPGLDTLNIKGYLSAIFGLFIASFVTFPSGLFLIFNIAIVAMFKSIFNSIIEATAGHLTGSLGPLYNMTLVSVVFPWSCVGIALISTIVLFCIGIHD